jgi:O-methyltransferase/methyltransferase family protein
MEPLKKLLDFRNGLIIHQAICAVVKLGVPDLMRQGPRTAAQLAAELNVNEDALYRTMRALAGEGVFEETRSREFANSPISALLCRDVPGSIRPVFLYFGTDFYYRPFGELLHSIRSGERAAKLFRDNDWEYMQERPELAAIFDGAMTNMSLMQAPAIAEAYDFGRWQTLTDVGGGNGILLSQILRRYQSLRGVLADQPHVLERARKRGFLDRDLAERTAMQDCDFFREVPSGSRAYVMKNVIHDWNDNEAIKILRNCRRAVPKDGVLLMIEWLLSEPNLPSTGKMSDLIMLVLTGGRERTAGQYRDLLKTAGFRLNQVISTPVELGIFEAAPS